MRITMLVLNDFTHDARVQKEARTLAAAGYDVTVLALKKDSVPSLEERDGFVVRRISLRSNAWRVGPMTQLARYLELSLRAARLAVALRADVCHAHTVQALPGCWLASRRLHGRLIYDAHEFEQGRDFSGSLRIPLFMQRAWSLPERLFIRSADAVLTVSDSLADALAASYNISRPTVLRNCPEKMMRRTRSTWLRSRFEIPADRPILLYQGNLSAGRGLMQLAHSAQLLPGVAIVFVGDGPLKPQLVRTAQQAKEGATVIFTGRIPLAQLPEVTASADAGVILTQNTCLNHYYTLPNKLFEYLQAGIPVLGCGLPEIAHVIREYQVGEIVDPVTPESIADRAHRVFSDPEYYELLAENTKRAAARFNWQVESQNLLSLYRHVSP